MRITQRASSTRGCTLGIIPTSRSGEALVHRRDMDRQLFNPVDLSVYDIVETRPDGSTTGRVSLPPHHRVLAFDGARILTSLKDVSDGTSSIRSDEVVVFRIEGPTAR